MNITLPPELEAFVNEKVASREYLSADALVTEALALLKVQLDELKRVRLVALKQALAEGLEDEKNGNLAELDIQAIWQEVVQELNLQPAREAS